MSFLTTRTLFQFHYHCSLYMYPFATRLCFTIRNISHLWLTGSNSVVSAMQTATVYSNDYMGIFDTHGHFSFFSVGLLLMTFRMTDCTNGFKKYRTGAEESNKPYIWRPLQTAAVANATLQLIVWFSTAHYIRLIVLCTYSTHVPVSFCSEVSSLYHCSFKQTGEHEGLWYSTVKVQWVSRMMTLTWFVPQCFFFFFYSVFIPWFVWWSLMVYFFCVCGVSSGSIMHWTCILK